MSAERTLLAYARTALALLAAGVAVAGALPEAGAQGRRRGVGALLVLLGAIVLLAGRRRHDAVDTALRAGAPLPRPVAATALTTALAVVAVSALVVVALV